MIHVQIWKQTGFILERWKSIFQYGNLISLKRCALKIQKLILEIDLPSQEIDFHKQKTIFQKLTWLGTHRKSISTCRKAISKLKMLKKDFSKKPKDKVNTHDLRMILSTKFILIK